jgi:hypothetical protein
VNGLVVPREYLVVPFHVAVEALLDPGEPRVDIEQHGKQRTEDDRKRHGDG